MGRAAVESAAVAKSWQDVFRTADGGVASPEEEPAEEREGFFRRLRVNLAKSREALGGELRATFSGPLDDETWERLEETLIYADVGARTTAKVVERLEREAEEGSLQGGEDLGRRLQEALAELARVGDDHIDVSHAPSILLTVGVNGTGKTTTIGKLAWHLQKELGLSVVMAHHGSAGAARLRRSGRGRLRCDRGGEGAQPRRRDSRHGRPSSHAGAADGGAREGEARDRETDSGCAARDAPHG